METPKRAAPFTDDRRVAVTPVTDDRRIARTDRRVAQRMRTLKGGQIVWPTGVPVKCIVRNLSQTGANLEVGSPVPHTFELVFDGDQSRRSCTVVWRKETKIGVKFSIAALIGSFPSLQHVAHYR
jgi:hypothetical protein